MFSHFSKEWRLEHAIYNKIKIYNKTIFMCFFNVLFISFHLISILTALQKIYIYTKVGEKVYKTGIYVDIFLKGSFQRQLFSYWMHDNKF